MREEDKVIIDAYREAFRKFAKEGVIDMDQRLKHPFVFQIHRLEDVVRALSGVVAPHRHSQFYVVLVKKGAGEKTIGRFIFPIMNNELFIIPKGVAHSSKYWSVDCSGYYISFNIDFFLQNQFPKQHILDKKIFKRSLRPFMVLTLEEMKKLETIFQYLLVEYKGKGMHKNEMLAIKVLELVVLCDRYFTNAQDLQHETIYNGVVERFSDLIRKNYKEQRSVGFYAGALHIHPNHLNSIVKKYTGLTAKETITDFLLVEAKFLLHTTSFTIKEIAYMLGFDEPDRFTSFFRKNLKLSPSRYRLNPV